MMFGADQKGLSIIELVVVVLTVVGGVAGFQQLASAITNRSRRRTESRILDSFKDRFDIEDESVRLSELRTLTQELTLQVETEIPRVARREYLLERQMHLVREITQSYVELKEVESDLGEIETNVLHPEIRKAIEDRLAREGDRASVVGLGPWRWVLILIGLAVVLPFVTESAYYAREFPSLYEWITNSSRFLPQDIAFRCAVTVVLCAAGVGLAARSRVIARRLRPLGLDRQLRGSLVLLGLGLAFFVGTALYAKSEDDQAREYARLNIPEYVLGDDPSFVPGVENAPAPQIEITNPKFDHDRAVYDDRGVAGLLIPALVLSSLGGGSLIDCIVVRRRTRS